MTESVMMKQEFLVKDILQHNIENEKFGYIGAGSNQSDEENYEDFK